MITQSQFTDIFNTNFQLRKSLKELINREIKLVDFTSTKHYRKENGSVEIFLRRVWEWSWMNSINTNYTCLFHIINFINEKENRKINLMDFRSDLLIGTIQYIDECVVKYRQNLFYPGSEVFKKMFFSAQFSWNKGLISTINCILTLNKKYGVECELNFKRGDEDDMKRGIDMKIFFEGRIQKIQHKSVYINKDGEFYISKKFDYNEDTYRNNLDLISIDCKGEILLFRNSKNKLDGLCGTNTNGEFFIHETLKIDTMENINLEMSNLLLELNQICYNKRIIFILEKGDEGKNYFEDSEKTIILFLNDIHDKNLINIIKTRLDELKKTFE